MQTAALLSLFRQWFDKLNVKSEYDGQRTRDRNRDAVRLENRDEVIAYLPSFHEWLNTWEGLGTPGLSRQTFCAAKQTTYALQGLIDYLLREKGLIYITLRHVQSDALENRFGWCRQLCGGNYFTTVRQFLQAEKTIRIRSLVKMGFNMTDVKNIFSDALATNENEIAFEVDHLIDASLELNFTNDLSNLSEDENSILCYVAGSISRSLLKKLPKSQKDCCRELITRGKSIDFTTD